MVSHLSLKVLPEQLIRLLHLLRQTLQGFLLQLRRHPVKGFGNAAGNAGKGVAVAAEGDRIAKCILKTDAFQKSNDCFRHSFLTGLHMMIGRPNFIAGAVQVITEGLLHILFDFRLAVAGACQKNGCRRGLCALDALRFVVYRFRWQKDTTNRRAKGQRAGDKSRTQLFLIVFKQKGVDLIDIINLLFQTVPHDPVPLGAIGEGIARVLEQVDGFIFGQVQPNRKGQHRFLFGVVVAIALNFGEMLLGDVGLLVHGRVFQPPARQ